VWGFFGVCLFVVFLFEARRGGGWGHWGWGVCWGLVFGFVDGVVCWVGVGGWGLGFFSSVFFDVVFCVFGFGGLVDGSLGWFFWLVVLSILGGGRWLLL